jgi:hypothetical protein
MAAEVAVRATTGVVEVLVAVVPAAARVAAAGAMAVAELKQRSDLAGRQRPPVQPHVREHAGKEVATIRRVAGDIDVVTRQRDGAPRVRTRRHEDAIEIDADRGAVVGSGVVVPGAGHKRLKKPSRPALGRPIADIEEAARATKVHHQLKAVVGVRVGD